MDELIMQERIEDIIAEYSQLPQLSDFDLAVTEVGDKGDVYVCLSKGEHKIEKTFALTDSLEHVSETFKYSDTLTPRNCNLSLNGLKMAYFDELGYLVVEREPNKDSFGTTERFKVASKHKEAVVEVLKVKLGNKLKA
jgi:hypothetical protein